MEHGDTRLGKTARRRMQRGRTRHGKGKMREMGLLVEGAPSPHWPAGLCGCLVFVCICTRIGTMNGLHHSNIRASGLRAVTTEGTRQKR